MNPAIATILVPIIITVVSVVTIVIITSVLFPQQQKQEPKPSEEFQKSEPISNFKSYVNKFLSSAFSLVLPR